MSVVSSITRSYVIGSAFESLGDSRLFPLTGVVDGLHSDGISHLRFQISSVDVPFRHFGSFVLCASCLTFYVFHGCRLQEIECGGIDGFVSPAHQALNGACGQALLGSVAKVQKAQVVIFLGIVALLHYVLCHFDGSFRGSICLAVPWAGRFVRKSLFLCERSEMLRGILGSIVAYNDVRNSTTSEMVLHFGHHCF